MKATERYFSVVLFIMLYKAALTFESVDEILKCDHSNESYWAVLSCGAIYHAIQGGSNFWVCGWNPKQSVTIQMKATELYIHVLVLFLSFLFFQSEIRSLIEFLTSATLQVKFLTLTYETNSKVYSY